MMAINLLPEACVRDRRARARVRIWAVLAPLVALTLMGSYVWLAGLWSAGASGLDEDRDRIERRLADVKREASRQQATLTEVDASRRALRAVSDLPDWGLLLQLLAQQSGGRATLTACTLVPAKGEASDAAKPAPGRVGRFLLTIQGVVEDPKSATDFAVDLERTKVFDRVTLVETARTTAQGREMLGFRIECALSDSVAEGQP